MYFQHAVAARSIISTSECINVKYNNIFFCVVWHALAPEKVSILLGCTYALFDNEQKTTNHRCEILKIPEVLLGRFLLVHRK